MHFHPELGPPPTVGLEYEVTAFKKGKSYLNVSNDLYQRGMTRRTFLDRRHDWHHNCPDCRAIGKEVFFPVQWKLERDASLPTDGCEFISSPFPTAEMFIEAAITALDSMTADAVWTNNLPKQRNDGLAESGFHIHAHANGLEMQGNGNCERLMRTLYHFLPEFFALSQSTNVERGLEYRLPSDNVRNHHSWMAFPEGMGQRGIQGPPNRIEWRLWEAPVDDLEYLEAAIYVSAAFTQLAYHEDILDDLEKIGILSTWDKRNLSMEGILEQANPKKLRFLRSVALRSTHLVEDERGSEKVEAFFARVE